MWHLYSIHLKLLVSEGLRRGQRRRSTEVADKIRSHGIRSPLSVHDVFVFQNVEAELLAALTELIKAPFGFFNRLDPLLSATISAAERIFKRREPRIELYDT